MSVKRVELVKRTLKKYLPLPLLSWNRECSCKKTKIEKKLLTLHCLQLIIFWKVIKLFTLKGNIFYISNNEITASPKISSAFLVLVSEILFCFWNPVAYTNNIVSLHYSKTPAFWKPLGFIPGYHNVEKIHKLKLGF